MTATGRRWLGALALGAGLVSSAPAVAAVEFTRTPPPYSSSGSGPFEWQFASDDPGLTGGLAYSVSGATGWERCRDAATVSIGDLPDGEYALTVKGDYGAAYHAANGLELPPECLSGADPGGPVLATSSFEVDSVAPSINVRRVLIAGLEVGVEVTAVDAATGPVTITAEHVLLANGSLPVQIPTIPFGGPVISSTEALMLDKLPEKLVVVGAGYIGLELGIAFAKLGSQVTVVEAEKNILPLYDTDLTTPVKRWLDKNNVTVHLGAKAKAVETGKKGTSLIVETSDGKTLDLPADKILVTVGRKPLTDGWGRVHGLPWLRVADASLFPDSLEINPYLTVMAVADRAADGWDLFRVVDALITR